MKNTLYLLFSLISLGLCATSMMQGMEVTQESSIADELDSIYKRIPHELEGLKKQKLLPSKEVTKFRKQLPTLYKKKNLSNTIDNLMEFVLEVRNAARKIPNLTISQHGAINILTETFGDLSDLKKRLES